jgi:rsbT co-antagonist protein RsbR
VPYEFVSKSGEVIPVLLSGIADRGRGGERHRLIAVDDRHEGRLRAEKGAPESEERFGCSWSTRRLAFAGAPERRRCSTRRDRREALRRESAADLIGLDVHHAVHPDNRAMVFDRVRRMVEDGEQVRSRRRSCCGSTGRRCTWRRRPRRSCRGGAGGPGGVPDISERKRNEEALHKAALQEELIRSQEATLRALATPLIPVGEGVLVMPLVGAFDASRAKQVLEVLLEGVAAHRARAAIIDVTGVPNLAVEVADGCSGRPAR